MPYIYHRTIYFQDTDAAGVVYFANVLKICHEAYEASLSAQGIDLKAFFQNPAIAIPITRASVDFYKPMFCGDHISVELTPKKLGIQEFEVRYKILANSTVDLNKELELDPITLGIAVTKHVCINPFTRMRSAIAAEMEQWLQTWQI
jgi:1,4-dihydroxy-2-naphthoyl-CoA hydrolase